MIKSALFKIYLRNILAAMTVILINNLGGSEYCGTVAEFQNYSS